MGFLFTVKGLRAIGVTQRLFFGVVGSVGVEYEFWGCGLWDWISGFCISRDTIGCVSGLPICGYSHCFMRARFLTLALCVLLMLLCFELVQWKEVFGAELTSINGGQVVRRKGASVAASRGAWEGTDTKLGSDWNWRLGRSGECGRRARVAGLVEGIGRVSGRE